MKTSLDKAKKVISLNNGGYNYYNKILIETTPDAKKNREFMIEFFGLNERVLQLMEENNYSVEELLNWIRSRNSLELDNNAKARFLFNNLIPVNNKEEALEKWGCEQDIDISSIVLNRYTDGVYYDTHKGIFNFNTINKRHSFDEKYRHYCLQFYCKDNISFKDRFAESKTFYKELKSMTAIEYNSNDFSDAHTFIIYKECFSKKPIGKKFCETLSKKYPEYKITYLMDNAITEELEYITYKNGKVVKEIKPQGKEGDEYNGPNCPYLKAVSIIDDPCYITCPECGKIIDNYQVLKNLECPYCDAEIKKYDHIMKKLHVIDDEFDDED